MAISQEELGRLIAKNHVLTGIRAAEALDLIVRYGGIAGDHHKAWVLDQVTRKLAGEHYETLVAWAKNGEDGPDTYDWDVGIAP